MTKKIGMTNAVGVAMALATCCALIQRFPETLQRIYLVVGLMVYNKR